jgi:UDP-GlcNAc:undecaprenyl-phosphate GlcNAc-1-phosphate transferase
MGVLASTLFSLVVGWTIAFFATPTVRDAARRRGWVDRPDGHRKLHVQPVPRLGGVAVFIAFAITLVLLIAAQRLGWLVASASAAAYLHLLVACSLVVAVGVADDIRGVSPMGKVAVQAVAALYLYFNGYRVTALSNPLTGEFVDLAWAGLPVTVLWFVAMSNAFNLIDGLDGLAAGVGLFSTTTLFIACVINERWEIAIIASALGGALLGFLRYNFNPASVFLGDSGALFLGFALAAVAVRGSMKSSAAIAVAAPLMALAVPLLDASIAVARRLVRGGGVFEADGDHIHHRLLRMGLTPRRVVAVLYAVTAAFGALSLLTMTGRGQIVGMVVIASSIVTWIGVQQLGYAEFAEIQRSLRYGLTNERRSVGNNVYLASLRERFAQAADLPQLRSALSAAMTRLQFRRAEVVFEDGPAPAVMAAAFPAWESGEVGSAIEPMATWSVPIHFDGRVTKVVLTRALIQPSQFDPAYLLVAIQKGLGPRLSSLASARSSDREGDRFIVAPVRPGPA